jgi:hypothetical protein
MTQSFDFGRLAELPADLRALFEAQRALLEACGQKRPINPADVVRYRRIWSALKKSSSRSR